MATPEQRKRRAAQRATAARVQARSNARGRARKGPSTAITRANTRAQISKAEKWASGEETPRGSLERKQAARMASLAKQGRVDPRFYDALKQYFYHKKTDNTPNDADEEYDTDADEDEE